MKQIFWHSINLFVLDPCAKISAYEGIYEI